MKLNHSFKKINNKNFAIFYNNITSHKGYKCELCGAFKFKFYRLLPFPKVIKYIFNEYYEECNSTCGERLMKDIL